MIRIWHLLLEPAWVSSRFSCFLSLSKIRLVRLATLNCPSCEWAFYELAFHARARRTGIDCPLCNRDRYINQYKSVTESEITNVLLIHYQSNVCEHLACHKCYFRINNIIYAIHYFNAHQTILWTLITCGLRRVETTPTRIERFHHRINVFSQNNCIDLERPLPLSE